MRSSRLTYANVTATLALVVALGAGGAFAATKLPPNSVGAKQLKTNAVKTVKIKNSAVTTDKIKNSAVTTAKVANGSLTAADLAPGVITSPTVVRHVGQATLTTGDFGVDVLTVPGLVTVTANCTDGGSGAVGVTISITNLTGAQFRIVSHSAAENPPSNAIQGNGINAGNAASFIFPPAATASNGHTASIRLLADPAGTVVNVDALTRPVNTDGCNLSAEVLQTP